ncbi:SCO family protein [Jannaschia aquimarina]|uniref:SCO1/SenC n=1 Tax=Jannaschia aquimarina TaxID=935700 RepID=A0A0D1EGY7_9RHOB|nr:SCO family protein [Jannaschia aquimarina]KIT16161.1 SCO1/SenC [Jannaschia aquimarina]SNT36942.1 protein SCO1/2 [Jannaschia aquimarina]
MATRWLTIVGGLAVAILALGTGFVLREVVEQRSLPMADRAAAVDLGAPFELVDQNGETITEAAFEGRPSLLFFGFTHCPEICPTTVYDIETWLADLDLSSEEMGAFFVTIDPERDTPEFLRDYLAPQSDRILGITGEPEKVWEMARSWKVYWQKQPVGGGDYTMDHYASVFVLDSEGRLVDLISFGEDPDIAKAKIRAALDA